MPFCGLQTLVTHSPVSAMSIFIHNSNKEIHVCMVPIEIGNTYMHVLIRGSDSLNASQNSTSYCIVLIYLFIYLIFKSHVIIYYHHACTA